MFECWLCQVLHAQVIWLLGMVSSFAKEVYQAPPQGCLRVSRPQRATVGWGYYGLLLPEPSSWLLFSNLIRPLCQLSSCPLLPTLTLAHPSLLLLASILPHLHCQLLFLALFWPPPTVPCPLPCPCLKDHIRGLRVVPQSDPVPVGASLVVVIRG
jgi:hypothetical protein